MDGIEQRGHAGEHHEPVPIVVSAAQIINGVEVPIGEPRVTVASRGALDLLREQSALDERRQRAREAGYDEGTDSRFAEGIDAAIEAATRVRLDADIESAAYRELASAAPGRHHSAVKRALTAAFRAAGFEVEQ